MNSAKRCGFTRNDISNKPIYTQPRICMALTTLSIATM